MNVARIINPATPMKDTFKRPATLAATSGLVMEAVIDPEAVASRLLEVVADVILVSEMEAFAAGIREATMMLVTVTGAVVYGQLTTVEAQELIVEMIVL